MSSFTDPLLVWVLPKERGGVGLVQLAQEFSYYLEDGSETITVEKNYITDFASIPRIARPFFCTMGKSAKPALLHDWLLHKDRTGMATRVFNESLKVAKVSNVGRWIMVAFVWLFTLKAP